MRVNLTDRMLFNWPPPCATFECAASGVQRLSPFWMNLQLAATICKAKAVATKRFGLRSNFMCGEFHFFISLHLPPLRGVADGKLMSISGRGPEGLDRIRMWRILFFFFSTFALN